VVNEAGRKRGYYARLYVKGFLEPPKRDGLGIRYFKLNVSAEDATQAKQLAKDLLQPL